MHITTHADVDVVAVQTDDEVTYLVDLTAPTPPQEAERRPQTIVVVVDRSGSMNGGRLDAAKDAMQSLVQRLEPTDAFGVVSFDDEARVEVPVQRLAEVDRDEVHARIAAIRTGGCTDLSAGYLLGLREAALVPSEGGATLLLLSDGHANRGVVDAEALGDVSAQAKAGDASTTTSTIGIGRGYDETLLDALARSGSGEHRFAEGIDDCPPAVASAVDGLLAKSVLNAQLVITPVIASVESLTVHSGLRSYAQGGSVVVQLGDLYAGEQRKVVFSISVPSIEALGLASVGEYAVRFTALPAMTEHTVTVPLMVNVVPGDEAAQRIPDPAVRVERLLAVTQQAKARAAEHLRHDDPDAAVEGLNRAADSLGEALSSLEGLDGAAVEDARRMAAEEVEELRFLAERSQYDVVGSSKMAMESFNQRAMGKRDASRRAQREQRPRPRPRSKRNPQDPNADADAAGGAA